MDVMLGFKQTEAGVIPEDWDDSQLAEIAKENSPICYGIVQVGLYTPNGIPVLAIKNLNSDYATNIHRTSVEIERLYARSRIRPNDVLISVKGTTGRVGIVPSGFQGNISRDLARLRLREGVVPKFCFQMLRSDLAQRRLAVAVVGTTRMELSIATLKQVRIPLPPTKAEQEVIAEALSDADALIESLGQLIAKKRHLKRGTMQELLRPKDGWVRRTLAQIVEIRSGGTPSTTRSDYWDGDILWCTPTDITALSGFKYLTNTNRTITKLGLKSSSAELIPANSIVMTSRATIGECAINLVPVSTNQGFKNFIPREGINVDFLYYLLLTKTQDFISLCGGSTFLEIGKTQLATFELALPTNEADEVAIAQVLSDMDAEIAALEAKLVKVRQIKQGMMQNLLTGKVRLV